MLCPACDIGDKVITDAEQFRATLLPPKGNDVNLSNRVIAGQSLDMDDEFFHVMCHVEVTLKEKIERGEFVDLERLLLREGARIEDERPIRLVERNGETFVAPSAKQANKITGLRKWDQAFCIYAAIFSKAQPSRAAEIWQYVHVIHTAASSFVWSNVNQYDLTLRHLMAHYPSCSWAKTYTQGWHLAMTDPLGTHSQGVICCLADHP